MKTTRLRRGFTLSELLIVIGIIAVLLAILLPALSKARAAANSVQCASNLRNIGVAMLAFAVDHDGDIPGSGATSGRPIWTIGGDGTYTIVNGYTIHTIPNVNEALDWCGPIAKYLGVSLSPDGVTRFEQYCNLPQFQCPASADATWAAGPNPGGTDVGRQRAFSYSTAMGFVVLSYGDVKSMVDSAIGNSSYDPMSNGYDGNVTGMNPIYGIGLPSGYVPKITRVGNTAQKIYLADSARRSLTQNMVDGPDYSSYALRTDCWNGASCQNQSMFTDWGAPFGATKAYDRSAVPGNNNSKPDHDVRLMAFRHGAGSPNLPDGSYRFNALFFDGHVESMDDLTAANPDLWLPKGSTVVPTAALFSKDATGSAKCVFNDVIKHYNLGSYTAANPYVVP